VKGVLLNSIARIVFWGFISWLFIRTFILQIFIVPSASMKNTLNEGDYVFVNKLAYGARLPITPLSIPYTDIYLETLNLPYFRLPGYTSIQNNDIAVFNFPCDREKPIDHKQTYVKRCIAIPGDTLLIKNGIIFINHSPIKKILTVVDDSSNTNDTYTPNYFPNNALVKWSLQNFGPFYIPKKGDSILLTQNNLIIYKTLLKDFELVQMPSISDSLLTNKPSQSHYCFKNNYYFMMGDNRSQSMDSRFWGLVPENHIVGKVIE
jgi:signal peptidase I